MATLNFKHLRYFWMVARTGSIARAGEQLHVTPQSISGQLRELEHALGTALFRRAGRGLDLTEAGRRILGYAEEIFALGEELLDAVRDPRGGTALPFRIGITDSVPKLLAYQVVAPVLHLRDPVRLVCREGRLDSLLADLSVHRLDIVVADRPMPAEFKVRAYNHLLGSSDVTLFGTAGLLRGLKAKFPVCLDNAPFLMPGDSVAIRPALERWFDAQQVRPRIVGEFDDGALLKAFGQAGIGLFPAPTAIAEQVCQQYGVRALGRVEAVVEQLYAITTERQMRHPATVAISRAAIREFSAGTGSGSAAGRRAGRR